MIGGTKIGTTKKMREKAVYKTAFFAAAYDFPIFSSESGLSTSIPVLISVRRIINALMKPALATATKLHNALKKISRPPLALARGFESILRMPRPIPIAEDAAIAYDNAMS